MSATTGPPAGRRAISGQRLEGSSCPQCDARIEADQEWCLECGAARTVLHRAPDWRVPVAVIGTVVLLVIAGFAIALVGLSSDASSNPAAQVTQTVTVTTTP